MTLAVIVGRTLGSTGTMFHGVSRRCRRKRPHGYGVMPGARAGTCSYWMRANSRIPLILISGQPLLLLQTNLYRSIAQRTQATIISGTNRTIGTITGRDCKPPAITASVILCWKRYRQGDGTGHRRWLGLTDLAELPARPVCPVGSRPAFPSSRQR